MLYLMELQQKVKVLWAGFFGFKLHLIINDKGEILSFLITRGNVDDRDPLEMDSFIKNVFGKFYADRGYISQRLAEVLFVDGIQLIYQATQQYE